MSFTVLQCRNKYIIINSLKNAVNKYNKLNNK